MRSLFLSLSLLLTLNLSAQIIESAGFGLELYPHLANRRLIAGNTLTFSEINRIDSLEMRDFGYGIGVFYAQRSEKIGYHFGLRYLATGYERARGPVDDNSGPAGFSEFSEDFITNILEIPFQLNFYQNLGNKSSFYFTLGVAAGIHLNSKTERTYFSPEGTLTEEFDPEVDYRGVNFALVTAVGYETRLGQNYAVGLQPTFEYWLGGNVIAEAADINRNLYNLGLRLTLQRLNY
ncbi:MAG: hypothetical protein AAFU03_07845 [Bacteroidota bacterium]